MEVGITFENILMYCASFNLKKKKKKKVLWNILNLKPFWEQTSERNDLLFL